jgi:hypothetical protein
LTIIVVDTMVCLVLLENMSETSSSLYILKEIEFLFSSKLFENWTYNGDLLVKWVFKLLAYPSYVNFQTMSSPPPPPPPKKKPFNRIFRGSYICLLSSFLCCS